jgi:signal peptidase II
MFSWIWIIIVALVIVLDQISKALVLEFLVPIYPKSFEVIRGVLNFTYSENDGMAFGMLDDKRWIFMTVSAVAIVALIAYMIWWRPQSKLASTGISFIIGGGIGNMIDRLFYTGVANCAGDKCVIDFIDFIGFGELWGNIFNVADSFVCIGAGLVIFYLVRDLIKETKAEKQKKLDINENSEKTE